jgi:ABC-type lipoprotein export system ATPase subunit
MQENNTDKIKKEENVSHFWEKMRRSQGDRHGGSSVSNYRPNKFLGTSNRKESDGKKRTPWLNSIFHRPKKDDDRKKPVIEKKAGPVIKNANIPEEKKKLALSKEEIEGYLGKNYENRQGKDEVIRVENVNKDFVLGETTINILKDVSFTVNQGEFVMLVGPSGCGKSTLLHSIYGLEDPTSGKVFIDGLDIWGETKNWRADFRNRYIGFIPQQAFWIKSFSVLENIAIPATINGENFSSALERAAKLIQLVQMEHRSDNRPYDLSGGEQQKIAMARALLLNPKFIIADEPTGNLDQKSGDELMDLFKEFNDRFNITILMVTHNPDQYKYSNNMVQMVDGRIVNQKKKR